MPYINFDCDWKTNERSLTLDLCQIFVNREILENFEFITIIFIKYEIDLITGIR